MKKIVINNNEYEIIQNDSDCFDLETVQEKLMDTDYFDKFDYIFGDYSYDKVRLKGYFDHDNPQVSKINDINKLDEYRNNYCSYGANTFLLKKTNNHL